ncbi:hypothetical protein BYT27DRAFT_7189711 [Phlegmacium glaucopus]|nr:hypothetical protein BYT27DRAFT_7189711 [Phlegmacium glaucopus]
MLSQSAAASVVEPAEQLMPRRIRHITAIQIRNLTPFPVRDAFTSALSQPVEQSHFSANGVADDLAAILSRKRSRKISTNSTATRRSLKWEEGILEADSNEGRVRASSASRITQSNASTSPNHASLLSSIRSTHSLRSHRARRSSITSLSNSHHRSASSLQLAGILPAPLPIRYLLPDNSQAALERIINSRLVETFITLAVFLPESPLVEDATGPSSTSAAVRSPTNPRSPTIQTLPNSSSRKTISKPNGPPKRVSTATSPSKKRFLPADTPAKFSALKPAASVKQDSRNKTSGMPHSNGISQSLASSRGGKPVVNMALESEANPESRPSSPVYFSPIHRPSTNPLFSIDTRSNQAHWPDTSGQTFKVEVWGKMPIQIEDPTRLDEIERLPAGRGFNWKLLDEWDVNLDRLVPLPSDLDANPSQLPSNTLIIKLSPSGQAFYLPSLMKHQSRSSSPSVGYASDPESEIRKAKQASEQSACADGTAPSVEIVSISRRRRQKRIDSISKSRDTAKTAGYQELFKLVTLQSCILDNESSLNEVVRKIDGVLESDETFVLRRKISESEARMRGLRANYNMVLEQSAQKQLEIADRAQRLRQRAESLSSARNAFAFDAETNDTSETTWLSVLRDRMHVSRTSLLSTLSTIFPIELYSPPDLLFTILDVPLPIPLTPNDPAPPWTLSNHKEVTEEAVATALGYTAQVLQILAAYLGKLLVYPVTCIGSRSLIRDGISSMVGPRMFPLFSKGVDTYRFEYGVFLLNKNIEFLMTERDLRALDMRHTLPNLKNLLLTLSHDNSVETNLAPHSGSSDSSSFTSGLETPSRESSPVETETPKVSHNGRPRGPDHGTTPVASGSTTPTAAALTDESKKAKAFLGLVNVPFAEFLRGRYPSSSQALGLRDDDQEEVDEEDRKTIHGVSVEIEEGAKSR